MVVAFDPTKGARVELGAVMANPDDAKNLESFAKSQIALLGMAAHISAKACRVNRAPSKPCR